MIVLFLPESQPYRELESGLFLPQIRELYYITGSFQGTNEWSSDIKIITAMKKPSQLTERRQGPIAVWCRGDWRNGLEASPATLQLFTDEGKYYEPAIGIQARMTLFQAHEINIHPSLEYSPRKCKILKYMETDFFLNCSLVVNEYQILTIKPTYKGEG